MAIVSQPRQQFRVEPVLGARWPQGMYGKSDIVQIRCGRIIQRDNFACIADRAVTQQDPHGFRGTARSRVQRSDNVKNPHPFLLMNSQNISRIRPRSGNETAASLCCYLPRDLCNRAPQAANILFEIPRLDLR